MFQRKKAVFLTPFLNRRKFLHYGFLSTAVLVMDGCALKNILTSKDTIAQVQYDLFPKAKELGINTQAYMRIILHHTRVSKEDKAFIKNGVKWLNEEAQKMYKDIYTKLSEPQRQKVLHSIANEQWGESWLYSMLSYNFEAMLGDPIYKANINKAGWKWLQFTGGLPAPKKAFL